MPVSDCETDESEALLANESVADVSPLLCGVKLTENWALSPAANVSGRVIPEIENSGLLLVADVMVTLAPEAVRVPVCIPLVPTVTLPNEMAVGDTAS